MEIQAKEIMEWRNKLNDILVTDTKQPVARIEEVTERNYFLSPSEAEDFGLIDGVFESASQSLEQQSTNNRTANS